MNVREGQLLSCCWSGFALRFRCRATCECFSPASSTTFFDIPLVGKRYAREIVVSWGFRHTRFSSRIIARTGEVAAFALHQLRGGETCPLLRTAETCETVIPWGHASGEATAMQAAALLVVVCWSSALACFSVL